MKRYKILVRESNIIAYYVNGENATNALSDWAENGYQGDSETIEDSEHDILGCEEVTQ